MRIAIASRIFDPEPSAASFRLTALADALVEAGHEVTVLTVKPPKGVPVIDRGRPYAVKRAPVLRDKSGYVRGYLPYLSFDIPLFLRILFGAKRDLIVVEPPPTTGFFARIASWLRRTPYAYYAADIWADASAQTGAPGWVVRAVRGLEGIALRGARTVLSVSEGVTDRLEELGVSESVITVGNGVDAAAFEAGLLDARASEEAGPPTFVYAGTASEWHGADVFVEALPAVLAERPDARLRFIGGGSEREALMRRADELGVADSVTFEPALPPAVIAPVLQNAAAAIASVRPGHGYDFAFPTKLYSAAICGAPLVYAGPGPAVDFVRTEVEGAPIGVAVPAQTGAVAAAMIDCLRQPIDPARSASVARWASQHVSLDAVAARAVRQLSQAPNGGVAV